MQDDVERARRLRGEGLAAQAAERPEGFEAGGDVQRGVRVQRPAAALMSRVQGLQQLADLGAAALADHHPVGPHAQALPHQVREVHAAGAVRIDVTGLQVHGVRVIGIELAGVLDDHDPLGGIGGRQHRPQQGRLAGPGAARDHERRARGDHGLGHAAPEGAQRAGALELGQAEAPGRRATQRDEGAAAGQGRQHGVQAGAVGQVGIGARRGVVQAAAPGGRQAHRELPGLDGREVLTRPAQPVGVVHPDGAVRIDQDVRDPGPCEILQRPEPGDLVAQAGGHPQQLGRPDHPPLRTQHPGHARDVHRPRRGDEILAQRRQGRAGGIGLPDRGGGHDGAPSASSSAARREHRRSAPPRRRSSRGTAVRG